jgi:uncharacterized membrane protein
MQDRVHHIDSLRGVAILMMLQGHFIDQLLLDSARTGALHGVWLFCRGFTAPIFFTASGLVIAYLMLRKPDWEYRKARIKRGIKRGFYVLLWGYALRISVIPLFWGELKNTIWPIHVLQCIGVGVILLNCIFWLFARSNDNVFRYVLLAIGLGIFIFKPIYETIEFSLPVPIKYYFYDRQFTLIPWLGFMFWGAFIGTLYYVFTIEKRNQLVALVLGMGVYFSFLPYSIWALLHLITGLDVFEAEMNNSFTFYRLGNVFLLLPIFMLLEPVMSRLKTLNEIGQRTLTVYIFHYIILYEFWFGTGLDYWWYKKLTPWPATLGAVIFLVSVAALSIWFHRWQQRGYRFKV